MNYSLQEIARITGAILNGDSSQPVAHIVTDTRRIDHPENAMFVALDGPNHRGAAFIQEAIRLGVRTILSKTIPEDIQSTQPISWLTHPDPLLALQELAAAHRSFFIGQLVAITGSNGKTQVKEWLSQILQSLYPTVKSPASYNSQLGVALSALHLNNRYTWAIMEAGISMPGEMEKLQRILKPSIGLITNLGDAHQENFATPLEKAKEKLKLFNEAEVLYYCRDHDLIDTSLKSLPDKVKRVAWSQTDAVDLQITGIARMTTTTRLNGSFRGQMVEITLPFTDKASVENLILVWLFILDQGLANAQVIAAFSQLEPIAMRLEQKAGIHGCTIINDSYNSDFQSLKIALDLLKQQTSQKKKTLIISDMLQTGTEPDELYRSIAQLVSSHQINRIIAIGPAISQQSSCFNAEFHPFMSTADFLASMHHFDFDQEAILLKGARRFEFEKISYILEERVHHTVLEIRMDDLRSNLTAYRKHLSPGTKLMVMVKAFSYGSGGYEIARLMANERVDYLGVAIIDEGIELRQSGVNIPIMVMNPDLGQADRLVNYHLEPEVFNLTGLNRLRVALQRLGIRQYPVHIKIDTGMHRLGFEPGETDALLHILKMSDEIIVKSCFSHLAASEDPSADSFSALQISRFNKVCEEIRHELGYGFIRHLLNSSGIVRFPEAHFDMVRLGIGLYGYDAANIIRLKPVAAMKTRIMQVHEIMPGEHVGYGTHATVSEPTAIAIVPVGYADGIDRRLGNGNYSLLVNQQAAPTIGNISMDMTILNVTGLKVHEGDEVVVLGDGLPVENLARQLGTIPYEIITSIPPRVKRIFLFG